MNFQTYKADRADLIRQKDRARCAIEQIEGDIKALDRLWENFYSSPALDNADRSGRTRPVKNAGTSDPNPIQGVSNMLYADGVTVVKLDDLVQGALPSGDVREKMVGRVVRIDESKGEAAVEVGFVVHDDTETTPAQRCVRAPLIDSEKFVTSNPGVLTKVL